MKVILTKEQFSSIKEVVDQEVDDFFNAEKGRFHLFAPIPINRTTASEVIKRILKSENKRYQFGQDIDLNDLSLVNRLRFGVYLDELLTELGTRGHNYEGFMTGIYDGYLPKDTNYWFDYRIREGTVEQKFIKSNAESPQLKTYASLIKKHPEYEGVLELPNTPQNIQKKLKMLNENEFLTDLYIFSTKTESGQGKGYKIENYVITKEEMVQILLNPDNLLAPKTKGLTALRISSKVLGSVKFTITTPRYKMSELQDLVKLTDKEQEVMSAFGKHSEHIRPDVIKDITKELANFIELLINVEEKYE